MKNILIIGALIFIAFVFINNFKPEIGERGAAETGKTLTAPFKYAGLLAKEPETEIEMPVRNLGRKQIADTFGAPRGNDRAHQGQDIFAKRGTPVYSATDGYVWRVGQNNLGGNIVMVLGAGGRMYYYAHLEKHAENLQVGDEVTTETVLGYVGTSGNAKGTPPHLHFGIYSAGGAINPLDLLK